MFHLLYLYVPAPPVGLHMIELAWLYLKIFKQPYKPYLLATMKEAEALGLFIQAVSPCNISTILMLLEVFSAITPLTLCLQKSQDKICLADIPNH